jgi:hypothetical protein
MQTHLTAKFQVTGWDESPFDDEQEMPKITRALVTKAYSGDIEGASTTQWLMAYAEDGSATFVGLERVAGSVAGRSGTFALRHVGSFEDGVAKGSLEVIEGSGSGGLASATGSGEFLADPGGSVTLNFTLDETS